MFDWKMFKTRDVVVHCKDDKQSLNFVNSATKAGLYFYNGTEHHKRGRWFKFTCSTHPFSEGESDFQANIVSCVDASCASIALEWEHYMPKELTLKDKYFRTGYVVELKRGTKYIVLRDGNEVALARLCNGYFLHNWRCFNDFDNDLRGTVYHDIVKVYDRVCRWGENNLTLIWERKEEVKEMTIEEVEKLVGTKVKIVGGEA